MNELQRLRNENRELREQLEDLREELAYVKGEMSEGEYGAIMLRLRRRWGLTPKQSEVLLLLYDRSGRIVPKNAIMFRLYQDADDRPEPKIVDVFISHLRAAMGHDAITTVWGRGYGLTVEGLAMVREVLTCPEDQITRVPRARKPASSSEFASLGYVKAFACMVRAGKPVTQTELIALSQGSVSQASVSTYLKRLRDGGLVVARPTAQRFGLGRGPNLYELTDKGRKIAADAEWRHLMGMTEAAE